jgi:phosphoribosylaminoimidazole-succinocarboxamide synthase
MEIKSLTATNFFFKNQTNFYRGKVRDVYTISDKYLVVVACDRISAFDHVLPKSIPQKGQVLTQVANLFLDHTQNIIPNWKISSPDPQVTIGYKCEAIPIEFVVRGYLTGHAWRIYKNGGRVICGVTMPEGLKENDPFPEPIITPATKAQNGHDEDISYEEILNRKIISKKKLDILYQKAKELYQSGVAFAKQRGLILVDTKYEFGKLDDTLLLIDEIHTPDSSRFFYLDSYQTLQEQGSQQKQLSKEFVREWLMSEGFQGLEGQLVPEMKSDMVEQISSRYIELYQAMTGNELNPRSYDDIYDHMLECIERELTKLN